MSEARLINFTDKRARDKIDGLKKGEKSRYIQSLVLRDIDNPNYNKEELSMLIKSIIGDQGIFDAIDQSDKEAISDILDL